MSKSSLERQADRAERLADQTVDERLKSGLLAAAKEYRDQAREHLPEDSTARPPTWQNLGVGLSEQIRATTGF
jgi:hypothetical protein